jgi:hypothetical protein
MLQICKPKRDGSWWEDEPRMERISCYCAQDVEAEYLLDGKLPNLTPTERKLWVATERANDRGIGADPALLNQLRALATAALNDINACIGELTNGEVPKVSNHQALTKWLNSRGVETDSCDKFAVQDLLDREDLDETVREVLEMRQEGGGSSIAKIPSILRRLSADSRLRGALVYGGAPATVRWSSHGAQLQNLPRHNKALDIEAILADLQHEPSTSELEFLHGPPTKICAELIRPVFRAAPGHVLVLLPDRSTGAGMARG